MAQELTFREYALYMHAGFAYLSAGALFLRQHAVDFLATAASPARAAHSALYLSAADVFFTLGLNSPPAELANAMEQYPAQIGEPVMVERKAYERRSRDKEAHMLALKLLLQDSLHSGPAADPFAAAAAAAHDGEDDFVIRAAADGSGGRGPDTGDHGRGREWQSDDVASCAGDGCLFITNVAAVDRPEHMSAAKVPPRARLTANR